LISHARRMESRLEDVETYATSDLPPETQMIQKEMLQQLFECLKRLSERERQIVALRFGAGTRNKDIATIMGLKEHSVSVTLMRALERLRGCQET
jgi:RNA polymerase sigma factor (sigma-70 family)